MSEQMIRVGDTLFNPSYVVSMNVTSGTWDIPETVVLTMITGAQTTYAGETLKTSLDQLKLLSGGMLCKFVAPTTSDDIRRSSR